MNSVKSLLNFYINSSIHVAFAVLAFTGITMHHFKIGSDADLLLFIFFATITGYNFVKYAQVAKLHHRSLTNNLRLIQVFSFFCFLGLIYFVFKQPIQVIVTVSFLGALNVLYALPISNKSNLRGIAGLKIFIIATVWTGTTVLLPLMNDAVFTADMWIECIQRFLFVVVLMLPFEIRDLHFDKIELGTIPQSIGVKNTRYAGLILLFLILILELLQNHSRYEHMLTLVVVESIMLLFLINAGTNQNQYYASFWVESIPIMWWVLIVAFG